VLIDLYVLAPQRSAAIVVRFLDHFLPIREPSATDYPVPEFSDNPSQVLTRPDEVIHYSVACKTAAQSIYWRRLDDGEPRHAHVFFLADGGLVLGLSISEPTEARWEWWLEQLKEFVGSRLGYHVCEAPPVESVAEFERIAT
jgi:hypothetical protein